MTFGHLFSLHFNITLNVLCLRSQVSIKNAAEAKRMNCVHLFCFRLKNLDFNLGK